MSERTPLLRADTDDGGYRSLPPLPQDEEVTIIGQEVSFTRLMVILSTTWLGVFLAAADTTVVATLSAEISSEFNSLSLLSWLAASYLIATAASQPIAGRLTDIFGRGPGLVFSNVAFAAGNLICGLARSQQAILIGRVIAGIGGGGLLSIPMFLGSDLVPLRRRAMISGIGNIWYGSGTMVGAVFGGILNDYTNFGWRMAFLVQVAPSLLSAVIVYFLVTVPPKQSDKSYIKRIDFLGVFLVTSFMTTLVLGLSVGGNIVTWTHPLPIACISLSGCFCATFVYWEFRVSQPIIPIRLLRSRTVFGSCVASMFCAAIALTSVFYVPLYLQARGDSPTDAGLKIVPASLGAAVGGLVPGFMIKRTGKYVGLLLSCIFALIAGTFMFTLQDSDTATWMTCVAFFVASIGYNATFNITQTACIAAVDHSNQAVVTSIGHLARSLGGTIGIALASVVYQSTLYTNLWARFGDPCVNQHGTRNR
ncbi:hypothetical protein ACHAP5_010933 [Fusarium lateritium]